MGVSVKMVTRARQTDLLTYLSEKEPHELIRCNGSEYRTKSHGSLVISHGLWYWHRGGVGGASALDYLIKVRGMDFVAAVEAVCGERAEPAPAPSSPQKKPPKPREPREFALPALTRFAAHTLPYLQRRGIHSEVISRCLRAGTLYESRYKGESVCVFVGHDQDGKARFACMRGVYSDLKQDVFGSDKHYSFHITPENPDSTDLAVYEAPIDALSGATLRLLDGEGVDCYRLSLGGTSPVALFSFLERHPQIERVSLCLDADEAGREATAKIQTLLSEEERFAHIRVRDTPPPVGKDYNNTLRQIVEQDRSRGIRRFCLILS